MRRIVIITTTLLVSALAAQAAPQKAPHHPTHRQTCAAGQLADQRRIVDAIERVAGQSDVVRQNPGMIELHRRLHSAPVDPQLQWLFPPFNH